MKKILYDFLERHKKEVKVHLICWGFYIVFEVLVTRILTNHWSSFYYYLLSYLLNISLFYSHALLILPRSFGKAKASFWLTPLFIIAEVGVYVLCFLVIGFFLEYIHVKKQPLNLNLQFFTGTIWRGSFFVFYATGYYYFKRNLHRKQQQMNKALELEQVKSQLLTVEKEFLRSQINPHLLFNTLSFIKFAAKKNSSTAAAAIQSLSEIMDYALSETNGETVPISREMEQVDNMINLIRLRFGNALSMKYKREIYSESFPVVPFILLTLVENVFKHGDLCNVDFPVSISILCTENKLELTTANVPDLASKPGKSIGLKNITLRLLHHYSDKHSFSYGFTDNLFITKLKIYN